MLSAGDRVPEIRLQIALETVREGIEAGGQGLLITGAAVARSYSRRLR
jgi:hypothetical protein